MSAHGGLTLEWNLDACKRRGKLRALTPAPAPPVGKLPRITRLMALAIRFDGMLREGIVTGYADLARLGFVTRARMTQIMNLLNLAPDIQEEILFEASGSDQRGGSHERCVREVCREVRWAEQRRLWAERRGIANLT
jgi:hypothetical protein